MDKRTEIRESRQKKDYIKRMETLFALDAREHVDESARLGRILDAMLCWYRSLPPYTLRFQHPIVPAERESLRRLKMFCGIFQCRKLNPKEVLLEKIPAAAGTGMGYLHCFERVEEWKDFLDSYEGEVKKEAAKQIKAVLGCGIHDDLAKGLKEWYQSQGDEKSRLADDTKSSLFLQYIKNLHATDEGEIVEQVSTIFLGIPVAKWDDESLDRLLVGIKALNRPSACDRIKVLVWR